MKFAIIKELAMKSLGMISSVVVVFFMLDIGGLCHGQDEGEMLAPMLRTEREALYSAIQGFVGNWWNGTDLYPDPCGWTPIQGVGCDLFDGFWYVTDLNIGPVLDNSLSCGQDCEFRPQLFELNHLRTISFFNCFSSSRHPMILQTHNWERLASSLQSIEFRSNPALVGPIPASFCSLEKIQSLVLLENELTGQIPSCIGNLGNLKRLVLSGNRFAGQVHYTLGNLDKLLIMDLSRNSLFGSLPRRFGELVSLLKLDLSSNLMVGLIPNEITNLKRLLILDLRSNGFTGGLTIAFQKMEALEELALSHNPIGGDLQTIEWQNMEKLVFLDLSSCGLTGEVPESMSGMKKLRYLDLSSNNLSGNLSPDLESLPSLGALYVHGNDLAGELKFSDGFYERMGRRFGAWGNPKLCYPGEWTPTRGQASVGVRPCQVTFHERDYSGSEQQPAEGDGDQVQGLVMPVSVGTYAGERIWWAFLLESFMIMFVMMKGCIR